MTEFILPLLRYLLKILVILWEYLCWSRQFASWFGSGPYTTSLIPRETHLLWYIIICILVHLPSQLGRMYQEVPKWIFLGTKHICPSGLVIRVSNFWQNDDSSLCLLSWILPMMEKKMATHSSVLAWRIPGTAEPGGLPSVGSHRVGYDWSDLATAAAAVDGSALVSEIHLFGSMCSHHAYSIQAPTGQTLKWLMTEADYYQVAKSFSFLVAYVSSMMDTVWWRIT